MYRITRCHHPEQHPSASTVITAGGTCCSQPNRNPVLDKVNRTISYADVLYHTIVLPDALKHVIGHPLFQRLNDIHQLGLAQFVFNNAKHTRAEHCLGVAYLASLAVSNILRTQPELKLTDRQVVWAATAGLCHDIGHGPFSHAWEKVYKLAAGIPTPESVPVTQQSNAAGEEDAAVPMSCRHECRSLELCRRLLTSLAHVFTNDDIDWICWMIDPTLVATPTTYRPEWHFLSEIVCNGVHGIDVDKLDYLARDVHHLCAASSSVTVWNANYALEVVRRTRAVSTLPCTTEPTAVPSDTCDKTTTTTTPMHRGSCHVVENDCSANDATEEIHDRTDAKHSVDAHDVSDTNRSSDNNNSVSLPLGAVTHWAYDVTDATVLVGLPGLRQHMHFVYYQAPQIVLLDATLESYIKLLLQHGVVTPQELYSLDFMISLTDATLAKTMTERAIMRQVDGAVLEKMNVVWDRLIHNDPSFSYAGCFIFQDQDVPMQQQTESLTDISSSSSKDQEQTLFGISWRTPVRVFDSKMAGGCHDVRRVADNMVLHHRTTFVGTMRSTLKDRFDHDAIPYGPLGKAVRHYHIVRPTARHIS